MKNCLVCDAEFEGKTSKVCCSKECKKERAEQRRIILLQDPAKRKALQATKKRYKDKTRHLRNKYDDMNKQNKRCIICEKNYIGHFQSKTCGTSCRKVHNRNRARTRSQPKEVYKDCKWCGDSFKAYRVNQTKFCSVKCQQDEHNSRQPRKLNGFKYVVKGCDICNEMFESYLGRGKYCSSKCANKAKKVKENPMRRISARLSIGIRRVVNGKYKYSNVWSYLDFTPDDFRKRFEGLFKGGMSWDNMGVWHIDHIRPVASFNYTTTECEDFKKCWALENLQPLWAADNYSKGNKWDGEVNA